MNKKMILLIVGVFIISFISAANYPAPFVENGESDTAVVYGAGTSGSDPTVATNLNTDLSNSVNAPTIQDSDIATYINSNEEPLSSEEKYWSEKQICQFTLGCASEDKCYPFGFIKDDQYCGTYFISSFERTKFLAQLDARENCTYDFQCKSNFCFNDKCINRIETLIASFINRISTLEWRIEKNGNYMQKEQENNKNISLEIENATEKEENFAIKLLKFFRR